MADAPSKKDTKNTAKTLGLIALFLLLAALCGVAIYQVSKDA